MKDLIGQKFGRLVVVQPTEKRSPCRHIIWLCQCECGNLKEVAGNTLKAKLVKSCGCLHAEKCVKNQRIGEITRTHGFSSTKLYNVWKGMKSRCYYLRHKSYKYYGGRGIKVCAEWRLSFSIFRTFALDNGYREGLAIDRINNGGNYEPSNVQFLTPEEHGKKSYATRGVT